MTAKRRPTVRRLLAVLLLTAAGIPAATAQEAGGVPAVSLTAGLETRLFEAEDLLQPDHFLLPQELDAIRALGAEATDPDLAAVWRSLFLLAGEKLYAQQQLAAGVEPAALALEELRREDRRAGALKVRKTAFWTCLGGSVGFLVLSNLAAYVPDFADRAAERGSARAVGFWWNLEDLLAEYRVSQVSAGLSVLGFALSAVLLAGGGAP